MNSRTRFFLSCSIFHAEERKNGKMDDFSIFQSSIFSFVFFSGMMFLAPMTGLSQFSVNSNVINATCPGDSNGSISVTVSGGSLPYTYLWSPGGEASASVTGLVPGNYLLTVTDNTGADTAVAYTVGPAPMQNDTTGGIDNPLCISDGSIILNVSGGNGGYQYNWSNGSQNTGIGELSAGDYSVVVTDVNNCTASFSFTLIEAECFVIPAQYFTPNDDGINDTWFIMNSQFFPEAHLIVFDRWGLKVYEHKGTYENWNGKSYLGIAVPDAVYYYFFFRDKDEKHKNAAQGSVTIIR